MGLNGKDKETISKIIEALKEITEGLEDARSDFRAIDAIDIALSLLEQQLEEDVEFIMTRDERPGNESSYDSDSDNDEEDDTGMAMASSIADDDDNELEVETIEPASLDNMDFKFLQTDPIPSVDELEGWFSLDFPEEDNT